MKLTKITLCFLVILYLLLLNLFSNTSSEQIIMSIWPATLLFVFFLLTGLLHRWFLKLFLSFNILIASVALFFKWQYHTTITEDILLSGLINDISLTTEMLSVKLALWVVATALFPIFLICTTKTSTTLYKKQLWKTALLVLGSLGLILLLFWVGGYEFRAKGQIRDHKFSQALSNFSPLDVEYNFNKARKALRKMRKSYADITKMSQKYHYLSKEDDLLVVFVLGESTRGDHLSLNGYPKETNPHLSKMEDIYSFTHVRSCNTLTIKALPCIFSPLPKDTTGDKIEKSSFVDVFRSLGFTTEIYSLQTLNEFYHYLGYDHLVSKYAVLNEQNVGAKDIALLPYAKSAIEDYHSGKKLIVLHTLGSHQTYYDRITPSQETFKPSCKEADVAKCSKEALINAYDNTIVGIDAFLSTLIQELSNKKAMLVYISDHGESLGEKGNFFHGKPVKIAPKEQFSVPLVLWFSKPYLASKNSKKIIRNLKALSPDTPLRATHLFHSILGCAGITSDNGGIDENLDICSP